MDETAAPRRRDADATREALLRAARRRFVVLGFERTTTRSIADDAGVNVSLISRYFGSKEGLYSAVLAESADLLVSEEVELGERLTRDQVTDRLLEGLRSDAWPSFGHQHPLLLFIRDTGADPEVDRLRRESLLAGVRAFTRQLSAEDAETVEAAEGGVRREAELAMALSTGLVVLQHLLGDELEVTRDQAGLRAAYEAFLEHLVPASPEGAEDE